MTGPNNDVEQAIHAAHEELKSSRVNVLIVGNTGVGKSTLTRKIFGPSADIEVSEGLPGTKRLEVHQVADSLLSLWDTRGFEAGSVEALGEIEKEINAACSKAAVSERIHIAWMCIASPSARIEPIHIKFLELLSRQSIPTIVVFTKSYVSISDEAKALAKPCAEQIEVLVESQVGILREPFGVDELVEKTLGLIPNGFQAAFAAAQRVSWSTKKIAANGSVRNAVGFAAGTALAPMHSLSLLAIQTAMFVRIDHIYELDKADVGRGAIKALATGGIKRLGINLFRGLIGDAVKATGVGYAAASAAGAAIGGSLTGAMGYAYVEGVARYAESGRQGDIDAILNAVASALAAAKTGSGQT